MANIIPLRHCPEREPTESEQHWFRLPAAPDLSICSRCWADHWQHSPFASLVELAPELAGQNGFCDFSTPRSLSLFRHAASQGNFRIWADFWTFRQNIPYCTGGGVPNPASERITWWQLARPSTNGQQIYACDACFQDYVCAGQHANALVRAPPIVGAARECDISWPCNRKSVAEWSDFNHIFNQMYQRRNMQNCAQLDEAAGATRIFHTIAEQGINSLPICQACCFDHVRGTMAQEHVTPAPQNLPEGASTLCFIGGSVPLRTAFDEALRQRNWEVFRKAAFAHVRCPPCKKEGISGGVWYSIKPAHEEFDVCEACYAGIFEPLGVSDWLERKPQGENKLWMCDLNLAAPLAVRFYKDLDAAVEQRDRNLFYNLVRQRLVAPPCQGSKMITGARWYDHEVFTCCPACWNDLKIGDGRYAGIFTGPIYYDGASKCDFFSARVRQMWLEAVQTGQLDSFIKAMRDRREVWQVTQKAINEQLAMMRMNAERQAALMMASVINGGANNIAAASSAVNFGNWGSSATGYGYETFAGAQGAAQFQQGVAMNTANGTPMMQITQLEGMWKNVE